MKEEKRRVPKLRFPGFTEDWEQRKAEEIFESVSDKGHTDLPILSASQELGMVYRNQNGIDIQYDKKNEATYKRVLPGQFVIHLRSFQGGFAYSEIEGITSPAYTVLAFKNTTHQYGEFWKQIFKSTTFIKRLETITYGIRDGRSISFNDFKVLKLQFPSYKEQVVLGDTINILEKNITLHQRKLENLKLKKKALLQKLFPKNGECYPELRFPGFTDAWEQRKFSEITYLSGIKNKDNYPYESYSISNEFGFIPQDEQFENGGTMKSADKRMYYIVSSNSFAYNPARINVGSIGYYSGEKSVIVSSLYEVFKTTEDINDKLLWHWFKSNHLQKLIERYQEGGVRLYFYYDKLCKGEIKLPSRIEQNKIATLLDSIDNYITLHQ